MKIEIRYAVHPDDFKSYDTARLRKEFLIEDIFLNDEISLVYSMYDRFIVGGAMPCKEALFLEPVDELKAGFFLERRELGIINTGGPAEVECDEDTYSLAFKEALYIGMDTRKVIFHSADPNNPARLYLNSAPAHHKYPSKKVTRQEAEIAVMGSPEASNHRTINKFLINSVVPSCQLQMGMTELKTGSVWNTMPVHTHNRRMEAYFYFEVPDKQAICHFLGDPDETRHIWLRNDQAVLSPSWSIHSAAGTLSYTFIWGMAGENLDYGDMDVRYPDTLK
jgi:4-deoxy-L-threo-5-hexosulose-uronate ketol-isomerase